MPTTFRRRRRGDTPPPRTGSSATAVLRGFLDAGHAGILRELIDGTTGR